LIENNRFSKDPQRGIFNGRKGSRSGQLRSMAAPVKRVMLWGVYRSLSSAISRAFRQRSDTKVIFEPFTCSHYFSEDRTNFRHIDVFPVGDPSQNYSEQWKKVMATPTDGESLIFTKDFPLCVPQELWPQAPLHELIHVFIIRHPKKCFASMMAQVENEDNAQWTGFDPAEAGYVEVHQMYEYVTASLGHDVLILDSDEFAASPEQGLRVFTRAIGVEYQDSMMHWDPQKRLDTNWDGWNPFFDRVQSEDGFKVPQRGEKLKGATDHTTPLPTAVCKAVDQALPIFTALFERRTVIPEPIETSVAVTLAMSQKQELGKEAAQPIVNPMSSTWLTNVWLKFSTLLGVLFFHPSTK